jgi:hypothetical protein
VPTAISTAAATVSAVASTATASNTGSEGLWVGGGGWVGAVGAGMMGKAFQVYFEKSLCWDD